MKKSEKERTLVINIKLTRGLVAVLIASLLAVAFVGYLALGQEKASASSPQAPAAPAASSGLRKYYRTSSSYLPTEVLTACATGYHFASLWEVLDPSNLEYAGEHPDAWVGPDGGEGPPSFRDGWIRTGYNKDTSFNPGQGNCDGWSSVSASDWGTMASLVDEWTKVPTEQDISVWDVSVMTCDAMYPLWCVED